MLKIPECRHGDGHPAVARYSTPEGCVCFPADREQDLCAQHIVRDGFLGGAELIAVYQPDMAEAMHLS